MHKQERNASRTAIGVGILRAMHELYDGHPKILSDPIIFLLLGEALIDQAKANLEWHHDLRTAAIRSHVVLRSRYAEDCLQEAVARGVRQYVSLGSGFDTFAYRQPKWTAGLQIFEVDHAASQTAKIERLRSAGIPIPPNVEFVAADLESPSLRQILLHSRLDFDAPTFLSCLGVVVYLREDSVRAIFELVATFPKNSELVFTFSQGGDKSVIVKASADAAAAVGEPWRTYHDPQKLKRQLLDCGFSEISFLTPDQAKSLYYRDRQDALPPPRRTAIARAIV